MSYRVNLTEKLHEAIKQGRFTTVSVLRAAGTPYRQHNVGAKKKAPAKKAAAKKTVAKKTTTKKS